MQDMYVQTWISFYGTDVYGMHFAPVYSMVLSSLAQFDTGTNMTWYTRPQITWWENHMLFYLHLLTPPILMSLLLNQCVYIWNGYLHSCGILCAVTCCFLHVLSWCTGRIFNGQGSRKHTSTTVIRSLIKLNTESCFGISMPFRIA